MNLLDRFFKNRPASLSVTSRVSAPIYMIPVDHLTVPEATEKIESLKKAKADLLSYRSSHDVILRTPDEMKSCFLYGTSIFASEDAWGRQEIQSYASLCGNFHQIENIYLLQQYSMDEIIELSFNKVNVVPQDRLEASELEKTLAEIVQDLAKIGASDLHITIEGDQALLEYRHFGDLTRFKNWSAGRAYKLLNAIHFYATGKSTSALNTNINSQARLSPDDFPLPSGVGGIRIEFAVLGFDSFMAVMRFSGTGIIERAEGYSHLHEVMFKKLRQERGGLIVFSGPTGSGKSTKLRDEMKAIIREQKGKQRLVTVESPIEEKIEGARQMPVLYSKDIEERRLANSDAIKTALRLDIDYLMIGECLTPSDAEMAFQAAETGHLTYTTVHSNDAVGIPFRFADLKLPIEKICQAKLLKGLIAQRLVQLLCPKCKLEANEQTIHDEEVFTAIQPFMNAGYTIYTINPQGCGHCDNVGAVGRTAVAEIVIPNDSFLKAVRNADKAKAEQIWLDELNGISFIEHSIEKMLEGIIDPLQIASRVGPLEYSLDRLKSLGIFKGKVHASGS